MVVCYHIHKSMSRTTYPSSKLSVTYHNMLLIYAEGLTGLHPTPRASRHLCVSCPCLPIQYIWKWFTSHANSGHVMLQLQGTKSTRLIYISYAFIFSLCMPHSLPILFSLIWYRRKFWMQPVAASNSIHKLPHNYCKYPVKLSSSSDNCSSQRLLSLQLQKWNGHISFWNKMTQNMGFVMNCTGFQRLETSCVSYMWKWFLPEFAGVYSILAVTSQDHDFMWYKSLLRSW